MAVGSDPMEACGTGAVLPAREATEASCTVVGSGTAGDGSKWVGLGWWEGKGVGRG